MYGNIGKKKSNQFNNQQATVRILVQVLEIGIPLFPLLLTKHPPRDLCWIHSSPEAKETSCQIINLQHSYSGRSRSYNNVSSDTMGMAADKDTLSARSLGATREKCLPAERMFAKVKFCLLKTPIVHFLRWPPWNPPSSRSKTIVFHAHLLPLLNGRKRPKQVSLPRERRWNVDPNPDICLIYIAMHLFTDAQLFGIRRQFSAKELWPWKLMPFKHIGMSNFLYTLDYCSSPVEDFLCLYSDLILSKVKRW